MSLETFREAGDLYLARGSDVNPLRPPFTGDVFRDVPIPGVQEAGMAMIVAHPCTMRGPDAQLRGRLLMAAVRHEARVGAAAWTRGNYGKTPLPDLVAGDHCVGCLDEIGRTLSEDLGRTERLACLSEYGVNLLQQRMVWHLTRLEVETFRLHEAFSHTFEEADLLEEWNDTVVPTGMTAADVAIRFEDFMRADRGDNPSYQEQLRDPQRRSAVRISCRTAARELADAQSGR